MSLNLYLDDCAFSRNLRRLLTEAGHNVQVPADLKPPLTGAPDALHLEHARRAGRILITLNPKDFLTLHQEDARHAGILAVYQDNNVLKDMSDHDIVQAIRNLVNTGMPIQGGFWILNVYRW